MVRNGELSLGAILVVKFFLLVITLSRTEKINKFSRTGANAILSMSLIFYSLIQLINAIALNLAKL